MSTKNSIKPTGAGKSSFELIDTEKLFHELDLKHGINFLDVACGKGSYCLKASEIIGSDGTVYGVDLWAEGIENLKKDAGEKKARNIKAFVSDAGRHIPVEDQCVDVCLLVTVLHDFIEDRIADGVMREVCRILKPEGTLAIVEFKKADGPPGFPKHIKLSPEEVAEKLTAFDFKKERLTDIGPYNYLMLLRRH